MLRLFLRNCYSLCFLFVISCHPLEFKEIDASEGTSLPSPRSPGYVLSPPYQEDFPDTFTSSKLDLVFVLDTRFSMQRFYQTELFGSNFLNRFQEYDWRFAYTDMSVAVDQYLKQIKNQREEEKEDESCGFLSGLILTVVGASLRGEMMTISGLKSLGKCFSNVSTSFEDIGKESEKSFADGSFLPFEHRGQKEDLSYLTQSVENYNEIFDHTVRLGNEKKWGNSYEAPVKKNLKAYPFLSMILSLGKGISSPKMDSKNRQQTHPFFRDDSIIVYVLVTTQDMQIKITSEQFKQTLKSSFGSEKRVKIIPVTLSSNSPLHCQLLSQQDTSNDSSKIRKMAVKLGNKPLDICSRDLSDKLFDEISKSLYSTELLSRLRLEDVQMDY